ncbi:MAG: DUF1194 domain-containing protein [Pseudomonadota bacterium]
MNERFGRTGYVSVVSTVIVTLIVLALIVGLPSPLSAAAPTRDVDTALVVAVDVSNSVDDARYRLQLKGIADALEDPGVISAILNGPRSAILFSIVAWSDRPEIALPWMMISSADEARAVAQRVRRLPRYGGEFTCMARMLRYVTDKLLPQVPVNAFRTVVDVSGDGKDNCNPDQPVAAIRDELAGYGTTINGLPILSGSQKTTLEQWYTDNVKGGVGSFILPANGFEDFGRAIRQKFVVEITMGPVHRGPVGRQQALTTYAPPIFQVSP